MKILMAVSSLDIGGAETHICDLASELFRMGEDVTVVSSGGANADRLSRLGVIHRNIPLDSHSPLKLVKAYLSLSALVKKENFDIIHAHSRIAAFICQGVARRKRIPFVTTVHAAFSLSPIKKYMTRWGYFVSAVSRDLAIYLRENYSVMPERIRIIPNGVDTRRFCPCREKRSETRVVFMSRLDGDCSLGAECLCDIAPLLAERCNGIIIELIGGGSEFRRLSLYAREKNLRLGYECIRLHGCLSAPEDALRGADVFVGVSRAALEAMACGVPVILCGNEGFYGAIDEKNFRDASESNFCGRGKMKVSGELLFIAISQILSMREEEREERGMALRRSVIAFHSKESMAKRTLELYKYAVKNISLEVGDVCLCGYYGFGNLGDDTLLRMGIRRARELGYKRISALTERPKWDRYSFHAVCRSRKNIFSVVWTIAKSRVLIFGGGTLIQERTSLRSLLYYCALGEIARFFSVSVELWGNGIGEVRSPLGRFFTKRFLLNAARVGARDQASLEIAEKFGAGGGRCVRENDLAVSSGVVFGIWRQRLLQICGDGYTVVCPKGGCSEKEYSRFASLISEMGRGRIVILAAYPREDRKISLKLCREKNGVYLEGISGEELAALLSGAAACVSMRLHPLIFASLSGIPYFGIGDDIKIREFCREGEM